MTIGERSFEDNSLQQIVDRIISDGFPSTFDQWLDEVGFPEEKGAPQELMAAIVTAYLERYHSVSNDVILEEMRTWFAIWLRFLYEYSIAIGDCAFKNFVVFYSSRQSLLTFNVVKGWFEALIGIPPEQTEDAFDNVNTSSVITLIETVYKSDIGEIPWCVIEYIIDHLNNVEAMRTIEYLLETNSNDNKRMCQLMYGMQFLFGDAEHDSPLEEMIEIVERYRSHNDPYVSDYAKDVADGMRERLQSGTR